MNIFHQSGQIKLLHVLDRGSVSQAGFTEYEISFFFKPMTSTQGFHKKSQTNIITHKNLFYKFTIVGTFYL